uniref:STAS domain-containing protein n=1 Tax=Alexandrium catenella TaxID=2925 RepID=A0A7S1QZE1_ALECA
MSAMLSVLSAIGYAGALATGEGLKPHFGAFVQQAITSQGLGTFAYYWCSTFRTHAAIDPLAANFMIQASTITARNLGTLAESRPDLQGGHALLLMSIYSAAFGLLSCALGRFRAGFVLRFIPYTVIGGLVGGFGLITVNIALNLAWGVTAGEVWQSTLRGEWLPLLQTLGTLAVAALTRCMPAHPLSTPSVIVGSALAFYCLPDSVTANPDWYLKLGPAAQDHSAAADSLNVWQSMRASLLEFHGRAIFNPDAMRLFVTFFGVMFIDWGTHLPAMDKTLHKHTPKPVDLDKEIKLIGYSNVLNGCLGLQPVCHSMYIAATVQSFGHKAWPLLTGAVLLVVAATDGWRIAHAAPRFAFAGLMMVGGIGLVEEWMVHSRTRIAPNEWYMLLVTALIVWVDSLLGLVAGLCLALAFSVVEYVSISGVKQRGTMAEMRSAVERSSAEALALKARADSVHIFRLYGYLFFGSISKAVDEIRGAAGEGARWIIADLALVPAIDASGVHGLVDLARDLERDGVMLILTGMVRRLTLAVENAGGVPTAATLDFGLQQVEEAILQSTKLPSRPSLPNIGTAETVGEAWALSSERLHRDPAPTTGPKAPWHRVAAISEVRSAGAGPLFREGDDSTELLILLKGTVQMEVWPKQAQMMCNLPRWHLNEKKGDHYVFEDHPQRLRVTSTRGTAINPVDCMHAVVGGAARAQFTAQALTPVSLLCVPFGGLTEEVKEGFFEDYLVRALASWMIPPEEPSVVELALGPGLTRAISMA